MTDQVTIVLPRPSVREGSAFTATAYFRDRATEAASTPTNVYYRIDCLTTEQELRGWTSATPGESVSISIRSVDNVMQDDARDTEVKQLTVAADYGLSTQVNETAIWTVQNILNV